MPKILPIRLAPGLLLGAALLALSACTPVRPAGPVAAPAQPAEAAAPTQAPTKAPVALAQEEIADVTVDGAVPLAGSWRAAKVPAFTPEMAQPGYDDSSWQTVDAPARWSAQPGLGATTGSGDVVVYRRTASLPAEWAGQSIGVSAWFNPYATQVFVNGQKIDPLRTPFAPYGDITAAARPGEENTVAVVVQYDGKLDYAGSAEARIGPLGTRAVTQVVHDEGTLSTPQGEAAYVFIHPEGATNLPGIVLVASGSHGLAELEPWFDTANDLARQGYAALALALPSQTPEGVLAGVEHLKQNALIDPTHVFVFGADEAAAVALQAAASAPDVRGVIALTPPMLQKMPDLAGRPALLLATEKYRGGLILNQLRKFAADMGDAAQVVTLPGDGHGTFVLTNTWNDVRDALLAWLAANTGR